MTVEVKVSLHVRFHRLSQSFYGPSLFPKGDVVIVNQLITRLPGLLLRLFLKYTRRYQSQVEIPNIL